MKSIYLISILIFIFTSTEKLNAQDSETVDAFISKIENYIEENFAQASDLEQKRKALKKRKSKVIAKNEILGQKIIRKIKFTPGGLKKDILKIWDYSNHSKRKMVEVISINDEYFKIQFITYHMGNRVVSKKSVEKFTAGVFYKKTNYDQNGKLIDKVEILNWE